MSAKALSTVRQFSDKFPAWTQSALRNLINDSKARHSSRGAIPGNGFARAIKRVGRKILIDEDVFFQIIEEKNRSNAA